MSVMRGWDKIGAINKKQKRHLTEEVGRHTFSGSDFGTSSAPLLQRGSYNYYPFYFIVLRRTHPLEAARQVNKVKRNETDRYK